MPTQRPAFVGEGRASVVWFPVEAPRFTIARPTVKQGRAPTGIAHWNTFDPVLNRLADWAAEHLEDRTADAPR